MFKFSKIQDEDKGEKEVILEKMPCYTPEGMNDLLRISGEKEIERNGLNYKIYGKFSRFKRSQIQFNC